MSNRNKKSNKDLHNSEKINTQNLTGFSKKLNDKRIALEKKLNKLENNRHDKNRNRKQSSTISLVFQILILFFISALTPSNRIPFAIVGIIMAIYDVYMNIKEIKAEKFVKYNKTLLICHAIMIILLTLVMFNL